MGLVVIKKNEFLSEFEDEHNGKIALPLEVSMWHPKVGFHSVAIVDHCLKTNCLMMPNFRHVTSSGLWIFVEDFRLYESRTLSGDTGINSEGEKWNYRLFGLKNKIKYNE